MRDHTPAPLGCRSVVGSGSRTATLDMMKAVLEQLAFASLRDDLTDRAFHAVYGHIFGHTRQELVAASSNPTAQVEDVGCWVSERFPT